MKKNMLITVLSLALIGSLAIHFVPRVFATDSPETITSTLNNGYAFDHVEFDSENGILSVYFYNGSVFVNTTRIIEVSNVNYEDDVRFIAEN